MGAESKSAQRLLPFGLTMLLHINVPPPPDPNRPLPCLPRAATEVLRLLNDPKVATDACVDALRLDVGLSTNVLRLANSPVFFFRRAVETLEHALVVLGRRRLRDLVVATAYAKTIPAVLPGYDLDGRHFWAHCAAVATYSEAIGRHLGTRHTSELFTAGLLHDCGKLLGSDAIDTADVDLGPMSVDPGRVSASAAHGAKHAKAGALLAKSWDMPALFVGAAKFHHNPTRLSPGRERLVASIVHVANTTAHVMGFGSSSNHKLEELDEQVVEDLGVTSQMMRQIAGTSLEHVERMVGLFNPF